MKRVLRSLVLTALAAGLLGADGCNGIGNVGVGHDHLEPTSPSAKLSSFEAPVLVTRDNVRWWGPLILPAGVSGSAEDAYGSDGAWTNLSGLVTVSEFRRPTSLFGVQQLPILPGVGDYQGPGMTTWATRGGTLVHGNTYRAELALEAGVGGAHAIESGRPLYARLSDEVALVPVVLVSWKLPGDDPGFRDQTLPGAALFDFIPPAGVPITPPDLYEEPPDELWAACGVQFQVVASFVFELPAGFDPGLHCGTQTATFAGQNQVEALVRDATPWHPQLGDWIVDDLLPVYVSYGELGSCAGAGGYLGKRIPGTNLIEVDFQRTGVITAHELGHVLLGQDHSPLPNNLMSDYPGASDRELTAEQCEQAHGTASNFSERFHAFHATIGRIHPEPVTELAAAPDDEPTIGVFGEDDGPETTIAGVSLQCCQHRRSGATYEAQVCGIGAVPVDAALCEVCCYDEPTHDVAMTRESDCPAPDVLADAQCDEICCTEFDDTTPVSRFACSDAGGSEIPCVLAPPN